VATNENLAKLAMVALALSAIIYIFYKISPLDTKNKYPFITLLELLILR